MSKRARANLQPNESAMEAIEVGLKGSAESKESLDMWLGRMGWGNVTATITYGSGLGGEHASEARPGALPKPHNNPQRCPYGLYAEQLSGTSFTTPRVLNRRSWLYRVRPAVTHTPMTKWSAAPKLVVSDFSSMIVEPNQLRWKAFPEAPANEKVDFLQGLKTVCGAGHPDMKAGVSVHIYAANSSMVNQAFCNCDGDMLIVPQLGELLIQTEFGLLHVCPGEIVVVQRGMRFRVLLNGSSRGYIAEVYDGHFVLPELGPIGANGLANPRDFKRPTAFYERGECGYSVIHKYSGQWFCALQNHSPFDIVAWHGNYAPFKYDLDAYCAVNSVTFDHPDPSIFTVLTVPTTAPGVAACDFVIFPPRWQVQDSTFRPPYYHRNIMSEFMGNIRGAYEAKPSGFPPGSGSLHSCMMAHGPSTEAFEAHTKAKLMPVRLADEMMAFMFESTYIFRFTPWAMQNSILDKDYYQCWQGLADRMDDDPTQK